MADMSKGRAASPLDAGANAANPDYYTGVIIIHGLGAIARNATLQEAIDSLSYWFNHQAGLALRPEGLGRVWVDVELTDDPNPDAPASRATMQLAPPASPDATSGANSTLRLEWREVWWAESFGLPSVSATIAWARIQAREQARHLLLPIGRKVGPARTAARTPARETPQALTYRASEDREPSSTGAAPLLPRHQRALLRALLWVYDRIQYVWKVLQWLVLTPLVLLLLLLMGIVRVLVLIPFLRLAVIATFNSIFNYVMLHWIASTQIYMTEYARASAIRQRFDRELQAFVRDERCNRIVVLAHSMGTVIAYEGLTTALSQPDVQDQPKRVTFICLAQALRRIWLLNTDDPNRVRGVLPEWVRWLHFWARYDPVAAGPLSARSLPRLEAWPDPSIPDPYDALCARLDRCENVDVVNTDSTFTDHITYWQNLEQVVGPVAAELVSGHPALEQLVRKHLATTDHVLRRRWSVAWRYSLALAGGLAAGIGLLAWAVQHPTFGSTLAALLGFIPWGAIVGSVCPPCQAAASATIPALPPNPSVQQLQHLLEQIALQNALGYVFTHYLTVADLAVGGAAVVVMGVAMLLLGQLVARPSPFRFPRFNSAELESPGTIFLLSALDITLLFGVSILFSNYVGQRLTYQVVPAGQFVEAYVWALGTAELIYGVTYVVAVASTILERRWGWLAGLVFGVILVYTDPFYRTMLLGVAVAGCIVCLAHPNSRWTWRRRLGLGLVAVMAVYAGLGSTLFTYGVLRTPLLGAGVAVEFLLPFLIYGLWSGLARPAAQAAGASRTRQSILGMAAIYQVLVVLLVLPFAFKSQSTRALGASFPAGLLDVGWPPSLTLRTIGVMVALLLSMVMVVLCLVDAARYRRWSWLIGNLLVLVGLGGALVALLQLGVPPRIPERSVELSFVLVATALIYALWAGAPRRKVA